MRAHRSRWIEVESEDQTGMRHCIVGRGSDCVPETRDRLVGPAVRRHCDAIIDKSPHGVGALGERPPVAGQRLGKKAIFEQRKTELVVYPEEIRSESQRSLVAYHRFVQSALVRKRDDEVEEGVRIVRLERQRLTVVALRVVQPIAAGGDIAEEAKGPRLVAALTASRRDDGCCEFAVFLSALPRFAWASAGGLDADRMATCGHRLVELAWPRSELPRLQ
jgi:hypothetical protein